MKLDDALDLILGHAPAPGRQMVPLEDSFGRICTENNLSRQPQGQQQGWGHDY